MPRHSFRQRLGSGRPCLERAAGPASIRNEGRAVIEGGGWVIDGASSNPVLMARAPFLHGNSSDRVETRNTMSVPYNLQRIDALVNATRPSFTHPEVERQHTQAKTYVSGAVLT